MTQPVRIDRIVRRLLAYRRIDESGCWLWTGCRDRKGYGRFTFTNTGARYYTRAHRVAFAIFVRPLGDDEQVDHRCEVRACFNPDHLQACSLYENVFFRNHGRANAPLLADGEPDPLDAEYSAAFGIAI